MILIHRETNRKVISEIVVISEKELSNILEKGFFEFNWRSVSHHDLFEIKIVEDNNIVGLMALKDVPDELRIEIVLLESSKENIGDRKKYERIAGCLIAWACRLAFIKGYFGFVSLIPKTKLIPHYKNAYGFEQVGRQLALDTEPSQKIDKKIFRQ